MNAPERPLIPTTNHPVLGELGYRADHSPPWIGVVPERFRLHDAEPTVDIYLPSDSLGLDASDLERAALAVQELETLNRDCQRLLSQQPNSEGHAWSLIWLDFPGKNAFAPDFDAVFIGGSPDPMDFDAYVLWKVKIRDDHAHSIRIDYW